MGGKTTIKCPWHAYHITVETGEGLYKSVDMAMTSSGTLQPLSPRLKSKGVKQRTHFVELRNHGQDVYVADSSAIPGKQFCQRTAALTLLIPLTDFNHCRGTRDRVRLVCIQHYQHPRAFQEGSGSDPRTL